jgi:hypothetical protein
LQKHYDTKTASYSWWPTLYSTCGRGAATLRRHSRFGGGFKQEDIANHTDNQHLLTKTIKIV